MNTRKPQSNRKRQCANETGFSPLLRKIQRPPTESPSPTKIIDLNDDCLLKIFQRLDMRSLFNVAVANEHLRPAAGIVYKQKYGEKTVDIMNENIFNRLEPFVAGNRVHVTNFKLVLRYLRCLGSSISDLSIYYRGWNAKQCDYIHQYLNQYCATSLVSIRFMDKPADKPITHMEKPFANVRTVVLYNSYWGAQFSSISKWFPNLHSLFIRTIDGKEVNLQAMLKVTESCQSIRNLKVSMEAQQARITLSDVKRLVTAHPSLVQLQLYGYEFSVDVFNSILRQLNSLEQFQFEIPSRLMYDDLVSRLDNRWRSSFYETWLEGNIVKLEREL